MLSGVEIFKFFVSDHLNDRTTEGSSDTVNDIMSAHSPISAPL